MMAGLGKDLVVNLAANTEKFRKGMNDAKGILGGFSSTIKSTVGVLTSFKTMLAGVAAAAGVGLSISALTSNIAKLAGVADEAAKTGLSGAFIQRLGYAADQSGVSAEVLTQAVKKLTINVGSGSKAFAELGLNLAALQAMSPEDQFKAVAEAIGKIPTAAGRMNAAVKLFGRSGADMVGIFAAGSDEITKLMADAQQLGIGLSDEMLARAAKADDSIQRMKSTFAALWDQITISLAPAIDDLATKIGDLVPHVTRFFDAWNQMGEGRWQVLGNAIVAAFDIAFATIEIKFGEMLERFVNESTVQLTGMTDKITSVFGIDVQPIAQAGIAAAQANRPRGLAEERLAMAQEQWADLKKRMNENSIRAVAENTPKPAAKQEVKRGLMDLFGDTEGMRASLSQGLQGIFDRAKIRGGALMGTLTNWLGSGTEQQKQAQAKVEPVRLAGAMARGSVEAYSTIVQAMVTRGKDPVVTATEKSSKAIVKAVKESKPVFNLIEAFGF